MRGLLLVAAWTCRQSAAARVLPQPIQHLHDPQIDLPPRLIDSHHLHPHLVADAERPVRVLAAQHVRTLDEAVVVVAQARDVHEPLDVMLRQLHEQSEGRHARDEAVELVADLVGHEPRLLPGEQFVLGFVGTALHLRAVTRDVGEFFDALLTQLVVEPRVAVLPQRAVDDQVRIPADGRGEVRVLVGGEPEVAEAHRVVPCLLHRPQHQRRNRPLLRAAAQLDDQPLEVPRMNHVERRGERVAQRRDELLEAFDLEQVGRLVHAVERRHVVLFEKGRDRLVRHEHELFDDAMRDVALEHEDVLDGARRVEDDVRFRQVEVDRTAPAPPAVEDLEELAHALEARHERLVPPPQLHVALEDAVHLVVRHAGVAVYHPVVKARVHDAAAPVDLHHARLHQPIDVRPQAAEPGRELRGEHVHGALGEVHRRGARGGLAVERAALPHVVRDVGDVHREAIVAVVEHVHRHRIVEVAGVLAVYGDDDLAAEIGAAFDVGRVHFVAEASCLRESLVGVPVGNAVLADDDLRVDARRVDVAEHLGHAPERVARRGRPARDLDDDHGAGRRAVLVP